MCLFQTALSNKAMNILYYGTPMDIVLTTVDRDSEQLDQV
jgi:hypothetical protein